MAMLINAPVLNSSLLALLLVTAGGAVAQVPVDDQGNPLVAEGDIQPYYATDRDAGEKSYDDNDLPNASVGNAPAPDQRFTAAELQTLVGPIALYPDDLLAIVLPASTYPLEIVQASRFLENFEQDNTLKPDEDWDESVIALLNYPEVLRLMDDDIDWTWQLGDAVLSQQADVIGAVEAFRDRAYAAGNLKSDERQTVTVNEEDDIIEIVPIEDDVIYVPYYEPSYVVHRQTVPVYHYYATPRPVYYYPYPSSYMFPSDYFWGVTTAFRIGWTSHHLNVYHPSYWGHPYYDHHYYYGHHYYRRPSIAVYNTTYVNNTRYVNNTHVRNDTRHRDGDSWQPRRRAGSRQSYYEQRVTGQNGDAHTRDYRNSVSGVNGATSESYRDTADQRNVTADANGRRDNASRDNGRRGVVGATRGQDTSTARPAPNSAANGNTTRDAASQRANDRTQDRVQDRAQRETDRNATRERNGDSADAIRFRERTPEGDNARRDAGASERNRATTSRVEPERPRTDTRRSEGNAEAATRSGNDRQQPSARASTRSGNVEPRANRASTVDAVSIRESLNQARNERQNQQRQQAQVATAQRRTANEQRGQEQARQRQTAARAETAQTSRRNETRNATRPARVVEQPHNTQATARDSNRRQAAAAPRTERAPSRQQHSERNSAPAQQQRAARAETQPQRAAPQARAERQAPQQERSSSRASADRGSNRRPHDKD